MKKKIYDLYRLQTMGIIKQSLMGPVTLQKKSKLLEKTNKREKNFLQPNR